MSDDVEYARWKGARSAEARDVWQAVSDRVQDEMTKGNWTIYFSRSRGLELTPERLVVGAPNTSAAEGPSTRRAIVAWRCMSSCYPPASTRTVTR
jgi:hypothetical protein